MRLGNFAMRLEVAVMVASSGQGLAKFIGCQRDNEWNFA